MELADLSAKRGCSADLATLWRGLRLFYDPRGRSTRTELFLLPAFLGVLGMMITAAIWFFAAEPSGRVWDVILYAFVLCPIPASAARRFHDLNKSGWFALPIIGLCGIGLWDAWKDFDAGPYASHDLWGNNTIAELMFASVCLVYAIILLRPPQDIGNRYGPNPRPEAKVI